MMRNYNKFRNKEVELAKVIVVKDNQLDAIFSFYEANLILEVIDNYKSYLKVNFLNYLVT